MFINMFPSIKAETIISIDVYRRLIRVELSHVASPAFPFEIKSLLGKTDDPRNADKLRE